MKREVTPYQALAGTTSRNGKIGVHRSRFITMYQDKDYTVAFFNGFERDISDSLLRMKLGPIYIHENGKKESSASEAMQFLERRMLFGRGAVATLGTPSPGVATPPSWPYGSQVDFAEVDAFFRSLADLSELSIVPWGDPANNSCYAAVSRVSRVIEHLVSSLTGARRWGGPSKPLVAAHYTVRISIADHCTGVIYDERNAGASLWSGPADGAVLVTAPISGSQAEWRDAISEPVGSIEESSMGPLTGMRMTDYATFQRVCQWSLEHNGWLIAMPGATDWAVACDLVDRHYDESFLYDLEMVGKIPWVFSAGRSAGEGGHLYFAAAESGMCRRLVSDDGVVMVSCF